VLHINKKISWNIVHTLNSNVLPQTRHVAEGNMLGLFLYCPCTGDFITTRQMCDSKDSRGPESSKYAQFHPLWLLVTLDLKQMPPRPFARTCMPLQRKMLESKDDTIDPVSCKELVQLVAVEKRRSSATNRAGHLTKGNAGRHKFEVLK